MEIETSTFGEDWYKMLESPKHADVTLVLEGEHKLDAHKIVLSSASKVFERIFGISSATQVCTITKLLKRSVSFTVKHVIRDHTGDH